jgi:hypothetical protein
MRNTETLHRFKVSLHNHLKALLFGTLAWGVFLALGLPDYYQQYSAGFMIFFCLAILPPLWAIAALFMRRLEGKSAYRRAILVSFYATVPLFVYDALFAGVYLGMASALP